MDWGREFQSFGAEQEREPSNNVVLDLGIDNVPLAVDLREREYGFAMSVLINLIYILALDCLMLYTSELLFMPPKELRMAY